MLNPVMIVPGSRVSDYLKLNCIIVLYCLDVYEQLKTQLWEDDAVTGLLVMKFTCSVFSIIESNH